ncbi:MAG: hypothetical protein KQI35_05405 [Bacteroidetes bacterium]|nr:hypothetical protein [Bacteroidota bacterium]
MHTTPSTEENIDKRIPRPFLLTILCIAFMVFSVFLSILFLLAIFQNNWITDVLTDYFPERAVSPSFVLFFSLAGFVTYSSATIGAILMLKMRKIGFYIYLLSTLIIIMVPHLMSYGNWYASGIFISMAILFALYFRKMH